ncbi:MAG: hypothetical protein ABSA46_11335 [Thermodesulfovibrionales bacterium]
MHGFINKTTSSTAWQLAALRRFAAATTATFATFLTTSRPTGMHYCMTSTALQCGATKK